MVRLLWWYFIILATLGVVMSLIDLGRVIERGEPLRKEYGVGYYIFSALSWLLLLYLLWGCRP